MLTWFLKFLEKCGRKYAFVDFYGDVLFYRYYVFFYEDNIDDRFIAKLPNIYIHIYNSDKDGSGPNVESFHSHPWSTLAFLIKGSYKEIIDDTKERITKRFGFAYLSHKQKHRIAEVEQDTTSIFMHGFRKKSWKVYINSCENICETCEKTNNKICNKTTETNALDHHLEIVQTSIADTKSWRALTFLKVDNNFNNIIDRRKKALKRLGVSLNNTQKEKMEILKKEQIEKRHHNEA